MSLNITRAHLFWFESGIIKSCAEILSHDSDEVKSGAPDFSIWFGWTSPSRKVSHRAIVDMDDWWLNLLEDYAGDDSSVEYHIKHSSKSLLLHSSKGYPSIDFQSWIRPSVFKKRGLIDFILHFSDPDFDVDTFIRMNQEL